MEIEDLLKLADQIVEQYLTTEASERAGSSNNVGSRNEFVRGAPWHNLHSEIQGDQVLANTILRMRDSMAHYEFHHAISDGDIGRALNIMAVCIISFEVE
jgi:hypothetical protein